MVPFLIHFDEKDKRFIIALLIVFIVFFVIVAYVVKLLRYLFKRYGRGVDAYMYDMCYYKVITNPKDFTAYVHRRERRETYYRSRWAVRIGLLATLLFVLYAFWWHAPASGGAALDFAKEALDAVKIKFSGWPKEKFFGIKIPNAFPHVTHKPKPIMNFPSIVAYIYTLIMIGIFVRLIHCGFVLAARLRRARTGADDAFTKKLENLSMPIEK